MSCNGCRVLRKGCSDSCILRPCLEWIESSDAQGHATVFVAKYFGRAGLMGFISAVHETQRPALFQSLLHEACGRTVNPVFGAVGLLSDGNWQACQSAVDTVLKGGSIHPSSAATSAFCCLPANLNSKEVPFHSYEKFSTQLPVGEVDGIQGAITPLCRLVTEPIPDNFNNRLGIGSFPFRCLSLEKHANCGPSTAMKSWRKESVRWHNMHQMLSRPNNSNVNSCIKHQPVFLTQEDVKRRRGATSLELHGTSALCPSPRRVRTRAKLPLVNSSEPQEKVNKELITSPRADFLELDLTLTVKRDKVAQLVAGNRVSSPSGSVNSEGSVTSLDSTPRDPSKLSSRSATMYLPAPPSRKLLPLLQ